MLPPARQEGKYPFLQSGEATKIKTIHHEIAHEATYHHKSLLLWDQMMAHDLVLQYSLQH